MRCTSTMLSQSEFESWMPVMVTTWPYAPDKSTISKSVVVPELVQVVTSDPSTEMSTVRTLLSPLYMAAKGVGGGRERLFNTSQATMTHTAHRGCHLRHAKRRRKRASPL